MNIIRGSIMQCKSGVIIHGCNAQGVMGAGVAKALREQYPSIYSGYRHLCDGDSPMGMQIPCKVSDDLYIVNAITQEFYGREKGRQYVDYDAIWTAFSSVSDWMMTLYPKFHHLHFPRIGSGLGGGDWQVIKAIIEEVVDPSIGLTLWNY